MLRKNSTSDMETREGTPAPSSFLYVLFNDWISSEPRHSRLCYSMTGFPPNPVILDGAGRRRPPEGAGTPRRHSRHPEASCPAFGGNDWISSEPRHSRHPRQHSHRL